ncbi:3 beta-hydroxysteroid dehydrogenase type 7-like isoform X2 [Dendropsophus ebraccatus]|uniref:3 beta-hydroxysteroid dehydrogenase type 7-like isoform X2 n=1 Tax=Dendropsophus ebraccatus TaxID=150705 RepID=UPI003831151B
MAKDLVYLVTGGSGFIGEWIVKLLLKEDYVKEVRIFDLNECEEIKHLDTGTENVINACLAMDVPYFVYTSSMAAVAPNTNNDPVVRVTEDTLYPGEPSLQYGRTKARAENLTRLANGQQTRNGRKLITCVIRPSTIYGEKTPHLLDNYNSAKSNYNRLNYIEPEDKEHSLTYVGNVAWMHVLAARQLQIYPDLLGGQVYYAYDETPFKQRVKLNHDLFTEIDPAIQIGKRIPYWKMWIIVFIYSLIKIIVKPFWKVKPFMTLSILNLLTISYSHDTDKAFRDFGYKPLFTWVESKQRVCQWLKREIQGQRKEDKRDN